MKILQKNNVLISLLILFPFSRGLFELFFSKLLAYPLSLIGFLVILFFVKKDKIRLDIDDIFFLFIFLTIIFFSILFSLNNQYNLFYLIYYFFILYLFIYLRNLKLVNFDKHNVLNFVILLFIFIATLEQLFIVKMPGSGVFYEYEIVRPSSITGSYLHYPIVLFFLIAFKFNINKFKIDSILLLSVLSLVASFSRLAFLMLLLFFTLFYFFNHTKVNPLLIIFIPIIILILLSFNFLYDRYLEGYSLNAVGNLPRFELWGNGLSNFLSGPFFVGNHFGFFNNFNRNFFAHGEIFESSLFFLLADVGFFGTLLFYFMIYRFFSNVQNKNIMFTVILFSSFFFQYLEIIPAIVSIFFYGILFKK